LIERSPSSLQAGLSLHERTAAVKQQAAKLLLFDGIA
jgi:hypothetical protein